MWACQALLKSVTPKGVGGSSPSASAFCFWECGNVGELPVTVNHVLRLSRFESFHSHMEKL